MLTLLLLVLSLLSLCLGDDPGIFYNPPIGGPIHEYQDNPVYELGQTLQILWSTTQETYSLILWQNDHGYEWIQTNMSGITSFNWIVSTNSNLSLGNVFFFQMRDGRDPVNGPFFGSHYFNITRKSSSPATTSAQTTSTSATATPPVTLLYTAAGSTGPARQTGSSAINANGAGPGVLSQETKIGVGLGVGLGVGFSLALADVVWYFRRQ